MATLASASPPSSPSRTAMRRRGWARKIERYCCYTITYFPLVFVYGLTSWAVWVEAGIGLTPGKSAWIGKSFSILGVFFYIMLNWSYTTAVFTDPGSPLNPRINAKNGYSHLPTQESGDMQYTSFTVKASDGGLRFCKKCQTHKPDRAHHCSTCKRCVLKMDHHCPWLATCVGLRNYKAFLLFLIYLVLFCWICFASSASWVWNEMLNEKQYTESFMPVNYVLLAVLSGIIGIVITGFTGWHLWLTARGQTTIESLEKTRYLSPLRESMKAHLSDRNYIDAQANGRLSISDQLREIHANALPGVTRPEEGESSPSRSMSHSPARGGAPMSNGYAPSAYPSYQQRERQRNQERYENYLDERDNELLPNAFDLGWMENALHVFGPSPLLWPIPICTTTGDGWSWEASPKWVAARDRVKREREDEERLQKERERAAGWGIDSPTEAEFRRTGRIPDGWQVNRYSPPTPRLPRQPPRHHGEEARYLTTSNVSPSIPLEGRRTPSKADQILGRESGMYADGDVQLQPIDRRKFNQYNYISEDEDDDYEASSDEGRVDQNKVRQARPSTSKATANWNDIPEDFLKGPSKPKANGSKKTQDWDDWGQEN